jgi:transcriptional regulator with XRE-family HTH domain
MAAKRRRKDKSGAWPNLGAAIRHVREDRNLSQVEVGLQIGLSAPALSRIESRGNLNIGTLRKISRVLQVEIYEIVRLAEELDAADQRAGLSNEATAPSLRPTSSTRK